MTPIQFAKRARQYRATITGVLVVNIGLVMAYGVWLATAGPGVADLHANLSVHPNGTALQLAAAFALKAVPAIILLAAAWHVHRLLSAFGTGDVHGLVPAHHVKRVGQLVLVWTLAQVVVRVPLSALETYDPITTNGSISVGVSSSDALGLACGLLFLIIAQALTSAHRVAQENKEFV
ncbi:MAG: hypothetical protein AAF386_01070 [Pseudomonadota bacterium]